MLILSSAVPRGVVTYKIKEMDDTPLEVTVPDEDLYRVENVLKIKGNNMLVR